MKKNCVEDQLEMVLIVFKIRRIRLLSSAPLNTLKTIENMKMFEIIEEKLLSLQTI